MDLDALLERHLGPLAKGVDALAAAEAARVAEMAKLRGLKVSRMPRVDGKAVASSLSMGGDVTTATGQPPVTPDTGWVWSVRHLALEGLTAGATPDVVNILRDGRLVWQLNGNQFAQTWGRGEMVLFQGETLAYASVGTFAATGTIIAHGTVDQIPAEQIGRFL